MLLKIKRVKVMITQLDGCGGVCAQMACNNTCTTWGDAVLPGLVHVLVGWPWVIRRLLAK